jgi:hypothetical protein
MWPQLSWTWSGSAADGAGYYVHFILNFLLCGLGSAVGQPGSLPSLCHLLLSPLLCRTFALACHTQNIKPEAVRLVSTGVLEQHQALPS